MRKITKIWLIVGAALLLLGVALFGGVMSFLKWDFKRLDTQKYQTNTYEPVGEFESISVIVKEADVAFLPSESDACRVVCYEDERVTHAVEIADGTLTVRVEDAKKWYHYIGFSFHHPTVTVYLPQGEYQALSVQGNTGDVGIPKEFRFSSIDISVSTGHVKNHASVTGELCVKTSTGDIFIEDVSCGALSLSVSTGEVNTNAVACTGDASVTVGTGKAHLTDLSCKNLTTKGNTGDLFLKNVVATEKISVERSTGDVHFDSCDAAEFFILTDTGDVKGTLRSDKIFIASADTGKIEVPKTTTGGRCEITTDTGDVKIEIVAPPQ